MNSINKCLIKSRQSSRIWHMALTLVIVVVLSSQAVGCNWSGGWNINWGLWDGKDHSNTMTLTSTGGNGFSGTYDWHGGQITGKVVGDRLTGTWIENDNMDGTFDFTMNAGCQSFSGTWAYSHGGDPGNGGYWDGKR
jgi:hypothetical protein